MVFNKLIGTLLNLNYKINKCWSYLSKMDSPPLHTLFISIMYCLFYVPGYVKSEKAMATHSSTLTWKIPWMEEPGRLQSMGSLRVGHDWATSLSLFTFMRWRRKWHPNPVFLPGESQGWGSLVGCHLWGHRVGHDCSNLAVAAATQKNFCNKWKCYIRVF